jgi:predicted LPLAT superfamily acyltransferase
MTQPTAPREHWGRPRFGYRANAAMLWIGSRFLPLAYLLIWFAALYFFACVPKARRASMAYLDRVRGKRRGRLRRAWETYRHMIEFGLLLLDRAIMLSGPKHRFSMMCEGILHLREALDQQQGLLVLTAHFGTAEASAPYMAKMGMTRPFNLVMYQDASDATERFHTATRRMLADMRIISTTDPLVAGVKIMRALQSNEVVAIRADRSLAGRTIAVNLLGGEVNLPAGPFLAAALTDAPVVNIYTCRLGYRRYTCIISPMARYGASMVGSREERMRRAAVDYAAFLEGILRKYPYQWGNFYAFWKQNP